MKENGSIVIGEIISLSCWEFSGLFNCYILMVPAVFCFCYVYFLVMAYWLLFSFAFEIKSNFILKLQLIILKNKEGDRPTSNSAWLYWATVHEISIIK
jgi:hypothetical protein